jgi:hypothetical protein
LLVAAALVAALYQSGCAGVTTAANTLGQFNANTLTLNLGNVALGDSKTVTLSFTNSTNSPVTVQSISVSGPGFSASGIPSGTIVNPGQTVTLSVTFTPASTGNANGSITATGSSQNSPITVTVALQASGVPVGNHAATLSWNPSPSLVAGYFIYRGATSGGPYSKVSNAPDANTTYTDSSVAAGQSYYYVVTAVDSKGVESSHSNEVSATIPTP